MLTTTFLPKNQLSIRCYDEYSGSNEPQRSAANISLENSSEVEQRRRSGSATQSAQQRQTASPVDLLPRCLSRSARTVRRSGVSLAAKDESGQYCGPSCSPLACGMPRRHKVYRPGSGGCEDDRSGWCMPMLFAAPAQQLARGNDHDSRMSSAEHR